MNHLSKQFPLALQLRDDATFENFYPGDNGLLIDSLLNQFSEGERYIYLYGSIGSGRSHLLQAACHHMEDLGEASVYLPLNELLDYSPRDVFEGLEELSLICLDDIQGVIRSGEWQEQLFHLFNRLADNNVKLIVAADCPARELKIDLDDLASRLSWGAVFQINKLSDDQRKKLLQMRAKKRGLELNDEVVQFIYQRCKRDTNELLAVLDQLDKASLEQQRRLTIPFVKATLDW